MARWQNIKDTVTRKLGAVFGPCWRRISPPLEKFWEIDGEQRAAAFSYYAFFSIFPLTVLLVALGSLFVDQERAAAAILDLASEYIPVTDKNERVIIETIIGVIEARGRVGLAAFVFLLYGAMRFFHVLVRGVNRAWDTEEYSWWQLPLRNLLMLGILITALVFGIVTPVGLRMARELAPLEQELFSRFFDMVAYFVPLAVLFYCFTALYKLAPRRRKRFSQVWRAAAIVTALLWLLEYLFILYFRYFGTFNVLYGAFGAIMAFLLWIYISGTVIILGACISSTRDGRISRVAKDAKDSH
jgi:YihY family inner membrane protein